MTARSSTSLPKRTTLTYKQRVELCEYAREHPAVKIGPLVDWATLHFRLPKPPSESTVRMIRSKEAEWRAALETAPEGMRRKGAVQAPQVEAALVQWLAAEDAGKRKVTGREIRARAQELADEMDIPVDKRPKFSAGWLDSFQERHELARSKRKPRHRASLSDPIPQRIVLTYKQRQEVCEHAQANPTLSFTKLAEWATEKFRLRKYISSHAVSRIVKQADQWQKPAGQDAKHIKHWREPSLPEVDQLLASWVTRQREHGLRPTGVEIVEKAKAYASDLGLDEGELPKFSKGWLQSFMQRHHLSHPSKPKRKADATRRGQEDNAGSAPSRKRHCVERILN